MRNASAMCLTPSREWTFRKACGTFLGLIVFFSLFAPRVFAQVADADAFEKNDNVRLVAVREGPSVAKVYAQLTNCTEVTVTLVLTLTNAVASEPLPLTVDSMGRTSFELVTIHGAGRGAAWGYGVGYYWQYGRRGDGVISKTVYDLPYRHGSYRVTQGEMGSKTHTRGSGSEYAIDWAMPIGTVICAAREGTVVALRQDSTVGVMNPKFASYGNFVLIRHEDGTFAEYGHLKRKGVLVWLGQHVARRGVIGLSGGTGYSSGPHLHFGVFQNIDGQTRKSIPVQFQTKEETVETLKAGNVY